MKILLRIICMCCLAFGFIAPEGLAAEQKEATKQEQTTEQTNTIEQKQETEQKATSKQKSTDRLQRNSLLSKLEVEAMLKGDVKDVCYYVADEDTFIAFSTPLKDKKARKKLLTGTPVNSVNKFITNSEAVFKELSAYIVQLEDSGRIYYGGRYSGGTNEKELLPEGRAVYKFWFMRLPQSSGSERVYVDWPIFIGGSHHRHHRGGGIGIGIHP